MRTAVYQSEAKPEPMLITARQAAQLLSISTRYLYTLTKMGRLRAKRIGRKVLYRLSDIQRFIDEDGAAQSQTDRQDVAVPVSEIQRPIEEDEASQRRP